MKGKKLGCLGWLLVLIVVAILLRLVVCMFSSFWSILGLILMIVAYVWMRQDAKKDSRKNRIVQITLFIVGLLLVLIFSLMCFFSKSPEEQSSSPATSTVQSTTPETVAKPEAKPEPKRDEKPATVPEKKPATETKTEPVTKPPAQQPAQPAAKPASGTPTKPASETNSNQKTETKPAAKPAPQPAPQQSAPSQNVYYKNCSQVKAAGQAPLHAGDPGYAKHLDRDGDGIACEK